MPKITKTFVDRLELPEAKPDGKASQVFYRDDTLLGFGLRVTSGGAKSFIVETRLKGKTKRITIGRYGPLTVEEARREAKSLLGDIARDIDPVAERKASQVKAITLNECFEDYLLTRKNLKPGTIKDYRKHMDGGLKSWGSRKLVDITKEMVEKKHTELGKRSKARANGAMRVLRALFNHAIHKYEDVQGNPIIRDNPVNRLSETRAWFRVPRRQRVILHNQLHRWHQATLQLQNQTARDYLHFLLFTGLRREEAASLRWSDVDLHNKLFTLPDTKNGDPHSLPIVGYVEELLMRRHLEVGTEWVFPSPRSELGHIREPAKAIAKVRELSGLHFSCHDLRRSFITCAEGLDIPAYALKRLMNHRNSGDVTLGYIIKDVERLREPMRKVSEFLVMKMVDG